MGGHNAAPRTKSSRWHRPITDHLTYLAAAGRPRTTITLRRNQLLRFAEDHPRGPGAVSTHDIVLWLGGKPWAASTRKSHRSAVTGFYRWAVAMGVVRDNPAALLPTITTRPGAPKPCPDIVYREALARSADDPDLRLMLLLAGGQGLRRGEIAKIHHRDLMPDLIGWSLLVHGKGSKERVVPLDGEIAALLLDRGQGWAFPSPARPGQHLSEDNVGVRIRRALPGRWSAHTLRHRFATVSYAHTRDLLAVQSLMGHSKPETTQGYILQSGESLRAAVGAAA